MRRSKKMLLVIPNPYFVLDHEARPSCVVRYDPAFGRRGEVTYVGATLNRELMQRDDIAGKEHLEDRHKLWDITYKYTMSPIAIEHTDYHIGRIREGSILAVDEATAKLAGIEFVDVKTTLAATKAKSIAEWKADPRCEDPADGWPDLDVVVPSASPVATHEATTTASPSASTVLVDVAPDRAPEEN